jgi:hypothetical protein
MVSLVILGIMGAALLRLFVSQSRFVDQAAKQRSARTVGRASLNFLMGEMRAVEATGGVVAASPSLVTLRSPFALGLSCGTSGGVTAVSLLPTDSAEFAGAVFTGYAWRDASGAYTYVESGATMASAPASACDAAGIVTLPRGRVVAITPPIASPNDQGSAVFVYQRVRYEFAASRTLRGRLALWRTPAVGPREEIAFPFDAASSFRFYRAGVDSAEAAPPANLAELRGLELRLAGASEQPRQGRRQPEVAVQRSAVFFLNHPEP